MEIDTSPLPLKHASSGWTWRLEDQGDIVLLRPRFNWAMFSLELAAGIFLWFGGYWFITSVVGVKHEDWMPIVWLIFIPAMLAFACVMRYLEYRFGPRLVVDRAAHSITLPKFQRTWRLTDVLGWQLIVYVRRPQKNQYRASLSQLVLVVQSPAGPERVLFLEGTGKQIVGRFERLLEELEQITGMQRLL